MTDPVCVNVELVALQSILRKAKICAEDLIVEIGKKYTNENLKDKVFYRRLVRELKPANELIDELALFRCTIGPN